MSPTNISSLITTLTLIQAEFSLGFGLVFLIFGVTGNFLSILLFSRRRFRTVSCCTYFLAVSVAMFIQLSVSSGAYIYSNFYQNPMYNISAYCKIWFYLQQSVTMMYRWMLSAACLDRYALTSTNARLRRFANVHIARQVVAAIVLIWIVFSIPVLILYDLVAGNCIIAYGFAAGLYSAIFIIISAYGISISIMITCSFLIRRNLANKRERRQVNIGQQQRINNREHLERKRDQQALAMLFAQIFVYIILTTPWVIFSIYNAVSLSVPNKSADRLTIERFVLNLVAEVILLFPTASFYLYTLTSSMFRKEFLMMLRSIIRCQYFMNTRRIEPTRNGALPVQ